MDKVVSYILNNFKGEGDVSAIVKVGNEYVFTLSKNGEPLIDAFYAYDGKSTIKPWAGQKDPKQVKIFNTAPALYERG